ncbi:uncharacterized protein M6B38_101450 [Iris pallida]|uniref:Hemerythrin-like domain-containing protein n=1 Tax=Iris pallida TaxID=29817 RepID=A0AAX6IPM8_IRIPA|nr:uncharacterized protein M6B38_101450 [Iris pallida]
MATPALIPSTASSSSSAGTGGAAAGGVSNENLASAEDSPILIFLFFQKAIRTELDRLHRAAVAFATDRSGDVRSLADRCRFLCAIYKHHCNAEDAVIFPALDIRVKNVAHTYSLEHRGESALFDQLFDLLSSSVQNDDSFRRELASCTGAIKTSLSQHMSKEEEQVFPLLIEKFSFEEQADLVWQFLCSIPVNMMAKFLPWLSSCISPGEHQDMRKCFCKIVPEEELLQQVIFTWIEGNSRQKVGQSNCDDVHLHRNLDIGSGQFVNQSANQICACEHSRIGKRKQCEAECNDVDFPGLHPIDEILYWHNAIRNELSNIAEEARKIQHSGDSSDLSAFNVRLQFVADVFIFHSIAEDQVIFPAVDGEVSFVQEHAEEERQFNKFRCLIEEIQSAGTNSSSAEFYSKLCSHADQIMDTIQKHFCSEEAEVLPLARKHFSLEKQRELLYRSICVMPLRLLEHVLPWFVSKLSDEEARSFLKNMHMAASSSDNALVTLFSGWACKGRTKDFSSSGKFICSSSEAGGGCPFKEEIEIEEDLNQGFCACASSLRTKGKPSLTGSANGKRPVKRGHLSGSSGNNNECARSETISVKELSCCRPCCVPGLGVGSSNIGSTLASAKPLHSLSYNSSAPSLDSSLFFWETDVMSSNMGNTGRPIDNIFKFHKAIRKDLEYLDVESGKLIACDEAFLRQFSGRFRLLWGLYRAHSNAEDDIVFPALESRETLHNVSHSYTLDHKQEEKLFNDI